MSKQANIKKLVKQLSIAMHLGRDDAKQASDHALYARRELQELVMRPNIEEMAYGEDVVEQKLRRALGSLKQAQHTVDKLVQEISHALGD